ncbi:MAG: hypothetical protein ABI823_01610 [Bryobacteraceae bacterium]
MTEREIKQFLEDNGYPAHVIKGGKKGLLNRWRRFVDEVESGYRTGLEDYRNDLDIRSILALLKLDTEVAEEDARLKKMLAHLDRRVWETDGDRKAAFWIFGYPKNASGDLLADLKVEGLAK